MAATRPGTDPRQLTALTGQRNPSHWRERSHPPGAATVEAEQDHPQGAVRSQGNQLHAIITGRYIREEDLSVRLAAIRRAAMSELSLAQGWQPPRVSGIQRTRRGWSKLLQFCDVVVA
jgi:hypothetical protein